MARKTKIVRIEAEGRDQGKSFLITELPASQAERWATRALMAMAKSNVDIPDGIENAGIAGIATLSLRALAGMPFADAEPLLDEMMRCVQAMPDPSRPQVTRQLIEDDIEEVATRLFLRREVIELHTDFSLTAALQGSRTAANGTPIPSPTSSDTSTSRMQ
jgi:hypothetical protein